jgi:hypothetical protein
MVRIAFAVFMGVTLLASVAQAACAVNPPSKTNAQQAKKHPSPADNCLNLTAVPQISAGVVAAEPAPAARAPSYTPPPDSGPYQGPTLGMSKPDPGVKPVPTVGYHWSLE